MGGPAAGHGPLGVAGTEPSGALIEVFHAAADFLREVRALGAAAQILC